MPLLGFADLIKDAAFSKSARLVVPSYQVGKTMFYLYLPLNHPEYLRSKTVR